MIDLYKNIKKRRQELKISQSKLAELVGYTNRSSIAKIEAGKIDLPQSKIVEIAKALRTTPKALMGWTDNVELITPPKDKGVRIPVLGRVAAGIPIEAIEEVIDWEEIPEEMAAHGEFFGLKIKGDSMEPRVQSGDIVIVRQQPDAESGEIVIATVNGDSATCKRLKKYEDGIGLISNNLAYPPMFFSKEEVQTLPVVIIGKVVELRGKF